MGYVFQVEWWENIIMVITCGLLMTMEIGKGIGRGKEEMNRN